MKQNAYFCREDFAMLDHIASPIFVLEINAQGEPVYAAYNSYALLNAGLTLDRIIGCTALQVYPGVMGEMAYQRHKEVAKSGASLTYELELPLRGKRRNVRTTLSPEIGMDGQVVRLHGSSVDITAEQTAREVQVSLDTLTSEMEQFVALAAHDLRTPMRNVAALTEMLRDGFEDLGDGKIEIIDMLDDLSQKSMSLISDVLSHARATNVKSKHNLFEFGDLCKDIFSVLDPQGQHTLKCTGVSLLGDQTAMQIVLRNLIDNAIKHGQRDHLSLLINVRPLGIDRVDVTIADDGVGFHNPGRAFLDDGEFNTDTGYGLLGIRRLIRARGGNITVHNNTTGKGSTISFSLPCQWKGDPRRLTSPTPSRQLRVS